MSTRLTPITRSKLIQRLRELGFEGPFPGRRHEIMKRGDLTIRLPNPHQSDISVDLLRRILRDSGVSREEWLGEEGH